MIEYELTTLTNIIDIIKQVPPNVNLRFGLDSPILLLNAEVYFRDGHNYFKLTAAKLGMIFNKFYSEISKDYIIVDPSNGDSALSTFQDFKIQQITQQDIATISGFQQFNDLIENNYSQSNEGDR